jgi:hypothetical protein
MYSSETSEGRYKLAISREFNAPRSTSFFSNAIYETSAPI